jgi:S1-C subfamily serine protease
MKRIWKSFFSQLLAGSVGAVIFAAINASSSNNGEQASVPPRIKLESTPLSRETKLTTSFAPVIKKVAPSVVNIYSTKTVRVDPRMMPFFDDPFLRRFFGGDPNDDPQDNRRRPRTREEQSLGSGVIVSEDGYILTNNHVVDGADEIKVVLADDKKEFTAKLIGTDPHTEVAVLKVDARKLPAVTTADSDQLEVGDVVLAIGNPFGIGQTVTTGIVSATGRGGAVGLDYEDFIQTDAAINPGNSGGALVDTAGNLIGVNSTIFSQSGGSLGIGFAIPVSLARTVLEQIIKDGVLIRGTVKNGPAEKAGILVRDVVLEIDGKPTRDTITLLARIAELTPGRTVTVKVWREHKVTGVDVTVGRRPQPT